MVHLKSVHFKKPVTRSSFVSKNVAIFVVVTLKMTTLFERNEDLITGFLKWTDFRYQTKNKSKLLKKVGYISHSGHICSTCTCRLCQSFMDVWWCEWFLQILTRYIYVYEKCLNRTISVWISNWGLTSWYYRKKKNLSYNDVYHIV